ncbi:MAG: hypothetical protein WAU45_24770 [Blastocatellia bacterium]
MKAKHHFWSSLAAGGALYWATGSSAALAGAMLGGFAIDADHVVDQWWSIRRGAALSSGKAAGDATARGEASRVHRYFQRRKLVRLPLIFHSYELLVVLIVLAASAGTPFLVGLLSGYVLHLALDLARHHHEFVSPLFYSLSYRLARGFQRERLIKPEYL